MSIYFEGLAQVLWSMKASFYKVAGFGNLQGGKKRNVFFIIKMLCYSDAIRMVDYSFFTG